LLESEKFKQNNFSLPIAIGKKINNENFIVDLTSMPHLLMAGANGTAVKAHGPGVVIGEALEGLASSTGLIQVHVHPHYWAGDLLASDSSGEAQLITNLTAVSSTIASLTNPTVNSPDFTFEGSAWDSGSSQVVTHDFILAANVLSTSTSSFTLTNGSSTLLSISNLGDTSVSGDLTVGKRLFLGSKATGEGSTSTYIYVDDTLSPSATYIATNADGWSTSSTYDYAERYASVDNLAPGDLVVADPTGVNAVKRSVSATDSILGIVSTKPGFITGGYVSGTFPIALAGRVPTKVSTENGPIAIGDLLTLSSQPGVAMKATNPGQTVGIALESYDGSEIGVVETFVKVGWQAMLANGGTQASATSSSPASMPTTMRAGLAKVYAGSTSVHVSFASIQAYPIVSVTPQGDAGSYWTTNLSDTGFDLVLKNPPTFDLRFTWSVVASQSGNTEFYSDNTSAPYDPLSGQPYGPVLPPPPVETTSTSSTPPAPVDSGTTTSTSSTAP